VSGFTLSNEIEEVIDELIPEYWACAVIGVPRARTSEAVKD